MEAPTLTTSELTILIEALKSWENKDFAGDLMGDMFSTLLIDPKKHPEEAAKMKIEREEKQRKRDQEKADREEQSIIIKAKLIQLRQRTKQAEFEQTFATAV